MDLPVWYQFQCEISRTYDDVVGYVIRESEIGTVYGRQVMKVFEVEYLAPQGFE